MKAQIATVLSAAVLAGACASGGGAGGSGSSESDDFICGLIIGACAVSRGLSPTSSPTSALAAEPARFVSWAKTTPGRLYQADLVYGEMSYEGTPVVRSTIGYPQEVGPFTWGAGSANRPLDDHAPHAATPLKVLGQSGIEVSRWDVGDLLSRQFGRQESPFTSLGNYSISLIANPATLGWSYQSFGIWNFHGGDSGSVSSRSFGNVTPASAVPTSGATSFKGQLAGLHVSPAGQGTMAAANVTVNADFSTRSLTFSSSGTRLARNLSTATAAPNLDLGGTLTYSPNTNRFSGTLTNAGATMSGASTGRFYGPAAQELGGVFTLKSESTVETFTGAYGAKR